MPGVMNLPNVSQWLGVGRRSGTAADSFSSIAVFFSVTPLLDLEDDDDVLCRVSNEFFLETLDLLSSTVQFDTDDTLLRELEMLARRAMDPLRGPEVLGVFLATICIGCMTSRGRERERCDAGDDVCGALCSFPMSWTGLSTEKQSAAFFEAKVAKHSVMAPWT